MIYKWSIFNGYAKLPEGRQREKNWLGGSDSTGISNFQNDSTVKVTREFTYKFGKRFGEYKWSLYGFVKHSGAKRREWEHDPIHNYINNHPIPPFPTFNISKI